MSVVQYSQRLDAYLATLTSLNNHMQQFTNEVALSLGVTYPATYTLPITKALQVTIYIRYFLDNIFSCVIALVTFLGVLLIYALLLNDVESKTYEYGNSDEPLFHYISHPSQCLP
jgi:predicted lysophospholipase L1 biosynthesis ABC-type transport system permease subunit